MNNYTLSVLLYFFLSTVSVQAQTVSVSSICSTDDGFATFIVETTGFDPSDEVEITPSPFPTPIYFSTIAEVDTVSFPITIFSGASFISMIVEIESFSQTFTDLEILLSTSGFQSIEVACGEEVMLPDGGIVVPDVGTTLDTNLIVGMNQYGCDSTVLF